MILKKLERSKLVVSLLAGSFILVVGGWGWAYGALRFIHEPLIIHFNNLKGINQVGSLSDLLRIEILALLTVLVNAFIAIELESRDRFLGKFVASATLFVSALIFIGFAAIISVN